MFAESPAVPAIEEEQSSLPACPCDGKGKALVRVSPRLGALPELRTYRCAECGAVETIEVKRPAAAAK